MDGSITYTRLDVQTNRIPGVVKRKEKRTINEFENILISII